jgi:hypothetical protein
MKFGILSFLLLLLFSINSFSQSNQIIEFNLISRMKFAPIERHYGFKQFIDLDNQYQIQTNKVEIEQRQIFKPTRESIALMQSPEFFNCFSEQNKNIILTHLSVESQKRIPKWVLFGFTAISDENAQIYPNAISFYILGQKRLGISLTEQEKQCFLDFCSTFRFEFIRKIEGSFLAYIGYLFPLCKSFRDPNDLPPIPDGIYDGDGNGNGGGELIP